MLVDIMQYPHDPNLTCNVLAISLTQKYPEGKMPPKLYVQMDNCGRENKNRFFFAFCGLMIAKGLVKFLEVAFLMTGHTHDGK